MVICSLAVLKAGGAYLPLDPTYPAESHDDVTIITLTVKESRELSLKVDIGEFAKIKELILNSALPRELQLKLCVVAEECFVNICSYAFEENDKEGKNIDFIFEYSDRIVMKFIDSGNAYDPRESVANSDDYDIDEQIGGLGKLIAFTVADSVDYEYKDGNNILTLKKYIKEKNNDDNKDRR